MLLFLSAFSLYSQNVGLNFDGTDDYVQTSYSGISGSSARTVEAWVRTSANCDPNNGGKQVVICDYGTASTGARFTFNILFNNAIRIEIQGSGLNGTKAINDGKWHHVAAVFDPSSSSAPYRLLVDGVLDVAGTISTSISTGTTNKFMIGKRVDNINYFNGDIDEVRFYNISRTDSAIKADMNKEYCNGKPASMVAYYKLNEGSAGGSNSGNTTATDYSKNANNGTLYNFSLSTGSASNWVTGAGLKNAGSTYKTLNAYACFKYVSPSGKRTWFLNGTYADTIPNTGNCDSVLTIKLTIGNSTKNVFKTVCDSFVTPGGKKYFKSGTYIDSLKNYRGCDSLIKYILTVNNSVSKKLDIISCGSYTSPAGFTYDTSGIYRENYKLKSGCDSIIYYHVTIATPKYYYDTLQSCDSLVYGGTGYYRDTTIVIKNNTWLGCDSFQYVTFNLTYSSSETKSVSACDSFVSNSGKKYELSGKYTEKYKRISGCDSLVIYNLNINKTMHYTDTAKGCRQLVLNGNTYNQSQWVTWKTKTVKGCDSFVSIYANITVIDTAIKRVGSTLKSQQQGAKYQWVNCNNFQPIEDSVNSSFTPKNSGIYACVIKLSNCTDTSSCYAVSLFDGFSEIHPDQLQVHPNPFQNQFYISTGEHTKIIRVECFDELGKMVPIFTNGEYWYLPSNSGNLFFLKIETSNGVFNKKLIRQ